MNLSTAIELAGNDRRIRNEFSSDPDFSRWHSPKGRDYPSYLIVDTKWEVEEKTVTISYTQYWEAVRQVLVEAERYSYSVGKLKIDYDTPKQLARKLGLEE